MSDGSHPLLQLDVDGRQVEVVDTGQSLLAVLREDLGERSPKDGCSPQGQCGCCTVLVDGQPRVACVTPARRVAGRSVRDVAVDMVHIAREGLKNRARFSPSRAMWTMSCLLYTSPSPRD